MRKRKQVTVTRGCVTGTGNNKTEAKADLERQIDKALAWNNPHVECRYGHVLIAMATPNGWQMGVVTPDVIARSGGDGPCFGQYGWNSTREEVVQGARMHAAQLAWTHDAVDDEHVEASGLKPERKAELHRWIRFQRSYTEEKARGKSDAEAFAIASGDPTYRREEERA